jgi:hypothetical protein
MADGAAMVRILASRREVAAFIKILRAFRNRVM